jgi:hypothetical protein
MEHVAQSWASIFQGQSLLHKKQKNTSFGEKQLPTSEEHLTDNSDTNATVMRLHLLVHN